MVFFLAVKDEAHLENKYGLVRGAEFKKRLQKAINHFYECGMERTLPETFCRIKDVINNIEDEELINIHKINSDIKATIKLEKKNISF